jgi:hypothetical protein
MALKFPCPNPTCTHEFTAAEFQASSDIACPRCGFKLKGSGPAAAAPPPPMAKPFPLAAPAPPAPPTAKPFPLPPTAKPLPSAPAAPPAAKAFPLPPAAKPAPPPAAPAPRPKAAPQPVARPPASPPIAMPVAPAPAEEDFDVDLVDVPAPEAPAVAEPPRMDFGAARKGPLVRVEGRQRRGPSRKTLFLVGGLVAFASVALGAASYLLLLYSRSSGDGGSRNPGSASARGLIGVIRSPRNVDEKVFRVTLPDGDWALDRETRVALQTQRYQSVDPWLVEAWKHTKYSVWFAVVVKDYGAHKPRSSETMRVAVEKLENLYPDGLELDSKAEPITFAELPAQRLKFKGSGNATNWLGDVYLFFQNGFAYWFYIASTSPIEEARGFAAELQKEGGGFTVLAERRGWRDQPVPTENYASENKHITVAAPQGVWEKHPPKDEDERGQLHLFGRFVQEKDNRKNAHVMIIALEKQADLQAAMKAARADLDTKKKEENPGYETAPAGEWEEAKAELGIVDDIGNRRGRRADLKLAIGTEAKRYILLAVVNEADTCYAIRCDCDWQSREIWRQDFLDLLRTLKVTGAAKGE